MVIVGKAKWYLKQLLPLKYETTFKEVNDCVEAKKHCTWNMWFGRCFNTVYTNV